MKNVTSNAVFVHELLRRTDICCLQEHWLFTFQLEKLDLIHQDFNSHAKAVDSRDPISPLQIPRGYAGTGILYRKNWDLKTNLLPDGCDRVVALELDTSPKICIINTYLPCRGNTTKEQFKSVLQQVEELLVTYTISHAVFICGDFNASLSRHPPNDRDTLLKDFVQERQLHCQQSGASTFQHPTGNYTAELDYILKNDRACDISSGVWIEANQATNTSDHVAVSTSIRINYKNKPSCAYVQQKPNWTKCNKSDYAREVHSQLRKTTFQLGVEEAILQLKTILDRAASASIPGYNPDNLKKKKSSNAKRNGKFIKDASRASKACWHKWKSLGAPTDPNHPVKKEMKDAKQKLRKTLRQANAAARTQDLEDIMQAKDKDAMFHRLIRKQRSTPDRDSHILVVNGKTLASPEEIVEGWSTHFETLGTPKQDCRYDNAFLQAASTEIEIINETVSTSGDIITPATPDEVKMAVKKLNRNKAADHLGLTAEHFKYGGQSLLQTIEDLVNTIFQQRRIPVLLKTGTITPVHKKGDTQCPDNYRGITVTPVILKIVEHILNDRHKQILSPSQSKLQSGFTRGTSSTKSALLITECQLEAKCTKRQLTLVTLDTRKAFDVVNHAILLRNLFLDGIPHVEWQLLKDMYDNMQSHVKWQGLRSNSVSISQGVRQGGILSTEHYKRYNNPLLLNLEDKFQGAKIGNISIPHATCADDLALLSHSDWEITKMLESVEQFSRQHRYDINAQKSASLIYNVKDRNKTYTLDGESIPVADSTIHLGIYRDKKGKPNIDDKINLGRRTAYSLLGAGFHGRMGLKQDIKGYLWSIYVVPRILFGLETLPYTVSDQKTLDSFQVKTLKQIQHLPDRTASVASGALLGIPPLSVQLHKNTLNMFHSILQEKESIEYRVAERQLATKRLLDSSFFSKARQLLLLYNLPDAYTLLYNTPDRDTWKRMLREATNKYVEQSWKSELQNKSSLKYINPDSVQVGQAHHVYKTVRPNLNDVKRSEIKVRLLTGTYTLQSNRAVFNQYSVDPTCKLCNSEAETRTHFISSCTSAGVIRTRYKARLKKVLKDSNCFSADDILQDSDKFTQVILDCSHPTICEGTPSWEDFTALELLSRELLEKLHQHRCRELARLYP